MIPSPKADEIEQIAHKEVRGLPLPINYFTEASRAGQGIECQHARAYPSPPMSGSPRALERRISTSNVHEYGRRNTNPSGREFIQEAYAPMTEPERGNPSQQLPRFQPEPRGTPDYGHYGISWPSSPYPTQQFPSSMHPAQQLMHAPNQQINCPAPLSNRPSLSANRPGNLGIDGSMYSPRIQRKPKGHVASACVPCKRAHLR